MAEQPRRSRFRAWRDANPRSVSMLWAFFWIFVVWAVIGSVTAYYVTL
jgi:hypothetical protein